MESQLIKTYYDEKTFHFEKNFSLHIRGKWTMISNGLQLYPVSYTTVLITHIDRKIVKGKVCQKPNARKFWILTSKFNFDFKIQFWLQNSILTSKFNFDFKIQFWLQNSILTSKFNFDFKIQFWLQNSILTSKFNFDFKIQFWLQNSISPLTFDV